MVGAILMALIAPCVAELPPDTVNANRSVAEQPSNSSLSSVASASLAASGVSMDPGHFWGKYFWGNRPVIHLSGMSPEVFQSATFGKYPGGLSSGVVYTTSITDFINADPNAGASNVSKKAARIGLIYWPGA
jgi:hypothetical protein